MFCSFCPQNPNTSVKAIKIKNSFTVSNHTPQILMPRPHVSVSVQKPEKY
jgi:hypothetical protein